MSAGISPPNREGSPSLPPSSPPPKRVRFAENKTVYVMNLEGTETFEYTSKENLPEAHRVARVIGGFIPLINAPVHVKEPRHSPPIEAKKLGSYKDFQTLIKEVEEEDLLPLLDSDELRELQDDLNQQIHLLLETTTNLENQTPTFREDIGKILDEGFKLLRAVERNLHLRVHEEEIEHFEERLGILKDELNQLEGALDRPGHSPTTKHSIQEVHNRVERELKEIQETLNGLVSEKERLEAEMPSDSELL